MMQKIPQNLSAVAVYIIDAKHPAHKVLYVHDTEEEVVNHLNKLSPKLRSVRESTDALPAKTIKESPYLFIWTNSGFRKIEKEQIEYLKAARSYCEICLVDGCTLVVSIPMSEAASILPPKEFIRIHRAYTVNLKYVEMLSGNQLTLACGEKLTIGSKYREQVYRSFTFMGSRNKKYFL